MVVNGWKKIKEYPYFTLWQRVKGGWCSCFWNGETPPRINIYD